MKKLSVILAVLVILTLGLVGCSCGGGVSGKYTCYKVTKEGTPYTAYDPNVRLTDYVDYAYIEVNDDSANFQLLGALYTGPCTFENNVLTLSISSGGETGAYTFNYDESTGELVLDIGDQEFLYFKK